MNMEAEPIHRSRIEQIFSHEDTFTKGNITFSIYDKNLSLLYKNYIRRARLGYIPKVQILAVAYPIVCQMWKGL